jgi:GT2 family glycosyltransferase
MTSVLRVPRCDTPDVSVILVTHNAWEWTEKALRALVETTDADYELIVIDNASADGTRERLATVDNARVVYHEINAGFGVAVNLGAIMARAPRLLLLNSDALVQPGWLPPLREVLDGEDDVAAVAAKLLHVDGRLQEAGGVIWGDGASDNYGDGDDPMRAEYRFRRDVDYASAACLLVRRSAFCDAGGFDPVYHPAYYEDTDLAMRWRSEGLRVVYQPRSVAIHKRWASSSDRSGMVDLLLRNRPVFVQRWRSLIGDRPPRPEPLDHACLLAVRDAECAERVVAIVSTLDGSDGVLASRILCQLRELDAGWRLTLLCLDGDTEEVRAEELRAAGIEVVGGVTDPEAWLRFRRHHQTAVIAPADLPARVATAVFDTQPCALRLALIHRAMLKTESVWLDAATVRLDEGTTGSALSDLARRLGLLTG